jgi:hypothetical protein
MPTFLINIIAIVTIILILLFIVRRVRISLLKSWKDVSIKEVIFHKLLLQTTILFYSERAKLKNDDNSQLFRRMSRYKKKKVRLLLLQERRDLFAALNHVYLEMEELDDPTLRELILKFKELQKARRVYNSKVLIYNQTISVFPTRFLAIKMELEIKEYFG